MYGTTKYDGVNRMNVEKLERVIRVLVDELEAIAKKMGMYHLVKPLVEKVRKELDA